MVQKSIAAAAAIASALVCDVQAAAPAQEDFAFRFNRAALAVPAEAEATYERLFYEARSHCRGGVHSKTIRKCVRDTVETAVALIDNVRLAEVHADDR